MEIIYTLVYTKKAISDIRSLKAAKLADKALNLCRSLEKNTRPLSSKALSGDLKGKRSIRINLQHRLIYKIFEEEKIIKILSLWNHYE